MTNVIERAKAHFAQEGPKEIEVPEWGDENGPLIIYSSPMTLQDRDVCLEQAGGPNLKFHLYAIIRKAKDADGNPIFTKADKSDLLYKVDPSVLIRVGAEIVGTTSVEGMEKN